MKKTINNVLMRAQLKLMEQMSKVKQVLEDNQGEIAEWSLFQVGGAIGALVAIGLFLMFFKEQIPVWLGKLGDGIMKFFAFI